MSSGLRHGITVTLGVLVVFGLTGIASFTVLPRLHGPLLMVGIFTTVGVTVGACALGVWFFLLRPSRREHRNLAQQYGLEVDARTDEIFGTMDGMRVRVGLGEPTWMPGAPAMGVPLLPAGRRPHVALGPIMSVPTDAVMGDQVAVSGALGSLSRELSQIMSPGFEWVLRRRTLFILAPRSLGVPDTQVSEQLLRQGRAAAEVLRSTAR